MVECQRDCVLDETKFDRHTTLHVARIALLARAHPDRACPERYRRRSELSMDVSRPLEYLVGVGGAASQETVKDSIKRAVGVDDKKEGRRRRRTGLPTNSRGIEWVCTTPEEEP